MLLCFQVLLSEAALKPCEKEFFDLYSSPSDTRPDNYYNKVNLGIDNSDTSSDLAVIQKALNDQYSQDNAIEINNQNSNFNNEILTIDLTSIDGINKSNAQLFFVENMNGHIVETNLSDDPRNIDNDILTFNLLEKGKEILVGLKSDDVEFNKSLKDISEEPRYVSELNKIIDNLKSNIFIRKKSNLEDDFLTSGTMQLNGSTDIDKLENIENVKGSDDKDHIIGSAGNNTLDGRSGNDIIYGGAGHDKIIGGDGDDIISGGSGNDYIDGGSGNDLIFVSSGLNATKPQTVEIKKDDEIPTGLPVVGTYTTQEKIEMSVYSGADLTMFSGVDVLYNYIIHNYEDGTANIVPVFHMGNGIYSEDWTGSIGQTILGGAGDDTLSFDNINNGVLLDFVFGIGTLDEVNAEGVLGSDGIGEVIYFILEGQTYHSFEKIIGSQVNDYIVNLTPWDHFMEIFGGQGNDNLIGSYGNEILSGGIGNDIISGGYGVDTLSGGEGFDKFIILDDTPTEDFKKQWVLSNPEDEAKIEDDKIFKSEDVITDFEIGVDTIDLTAISNSGVDLSDNVDINDISIKKKNEDENNFDAVMEINTSTVDVSITLENFGLVSQQTEEELLQSILV